MVDNAIVNTQGQDRITVARAQVQSLFPFAGAAKGIGLACASCLGHEGAKVVVADIDDASASR